MLIFSSNLKSCLHRGIRGYYLQFYVIKCNRKTKENIDTQVGMERHSLELSFQIREQGAEDLCGRID